MICPRCGFNNAEIARICRNCGNQLPPRPMKQQQPIRPAVSKNNNTALILGLACGAISLIAVIIVVILLTNRQTSHEDDYTIVQEEQSSVDETRPVTLFPADAYNSDPRFQSFGWLLDPIDSSDLAGLSKDELRILRNAIFAINGYRFKSNDLAEYFSQFDWYTPMYSDVTSRLSQTEKNNIALIKRLESNR